MDITKKTETVVTTRYKGVITSNELRKVFNLPSTCVIHVKVPGGGDWSNCILEIGSETDIYVSWSVTQETEQE